MSYFNNVNTITYECVQTPEISSIPTVNQQIRNGNIITYQTNMDNSISNVNKVSPHTKAFANISDYILGEKNDASRPEENEDDDVFQLDDIAAPDYSSSLPSLINDSFSDDEFEIEFDMEDEKNDGSGSNEDEFWLYDSPSSPVLSAKQSRSEKQFIKPVFNYELNSNLQLINQRKSSITEDNYRLWLASQ